MFPGSDHAAVAALPEGPNGGVDFRLSMRLRNDRAPWLAPTERTRKFSLGEFAEPSSPQALPARQEWEEPDAWDWAGLRRQFARALGGNRRMRFERDAVWVQAERLGGPARLPGLLADASLAARVRARLASEPMLRGIAMTAQCREGRVLVHTRSANCRQAAQTLALVLAVDGVREAGIDLPEDLQREQAVGR